MFGKFFCCISCYMMCSKDNPKGCNTAAFKVRPQLVHTKMIAFMQHIICCQVCRPFFYCSDTRLFFTQHNLYSSSIHSSLVGLTPPMVKGSGCDDMKGKYY